MRIRFSQGTGIKLTQTINNKKTIVPQMPQLEELTAGR